MFGVDLLIRKKKMEFTTYVRKEGRITVPKEIRDALGIKEDELVTCTITKTRGA